MKFLKEKKVIIVSFIIGVILASSITVYATNYYAKDITYKDGKTVEYALNDLYSKSNTNTTNKQWAEGNTTLPSNLILEMTNLDFKPSRLTLIFSNSRGRTTYVVNNNNEVVYTVAENNYGEWGSQELGVQISLLDNGFRYTTTYEAFADSSIYWFAAR